MATMPRLGERRTPTPRRGIASVDLTAEGRAIEGFGNTMRAAGEDMMKREAEQKKLAEQEADAAAVFDRRRQLDDWERTNLYDSQNGAVAKLGRDAFDLPTTIPKSFDAFSGKLAEGLTTPRARQAVQEMIVSRRDQALNYVDRHTFQQRQVFEEGQFKADIDSSLNRAANLRAAGDMATGDAEVSLMQTRIVGRYKAQGKSEEETAVAVRNLASVDAVSTVNVLLEQGKALQAEAFLKSKAGAMKVEDLLRAQTAVGKAVDGVKAEVAAEEVDRRILRPATAPNEFGRLVNLAGAPNAEGLAALVMKAESGGKRFGPDGKLLTSSKGAQGEMQVMPATAKNPGYGIRPVKDGSPEELARVGRDYLKAMLMEFKGNVPQALAAYNAGPGRVQQAMEAAAKGRSGSVDWLSYMPDETKAYVAKITKQFGDGGGAPKMPSLRDTHDAVDAMFPPEQANLRKLAREAVTKRYADAEKGMKQQADQNTIAVFDWLANNGGDITKLPANLRSNLPPEKFDDAIRYSKVIVEGVPVQTDWDLYSNLRAIAVTDPAKFGATDLRLHFPKLGTTQREQLLDLQTKTNDPKKVPEVQTFQQQLSVAHNLLDIRSNEKRKGQFDSAVAEVVAAETREKKRELTFEERDKIIKRLMLPSESSWYQSEKRLYQVAGTSAASGAVPKIDEDMRKMITSALTAEGVKAPTEQDIRVRFNLRFGIR